MGRREAFIGFWWENPEGKRQLGRPRGRWEDNIRMDFQEVVYGGMDWIGLAQECGNEFSVSIKCGVFLD
jgi:hypothetical protein